MALALGLRPKRRQACGRLSQGAMCTQRDADLTECLQEPLSIQTTITEIRGSVYPKELQVMSWTKRAPLIRCDSCDCLLKFKRRVGVIASEAIPSVQLVKRQRSEWQAVNTDGTAHHCKYRRLNHEKAKATSTED